MIYIQAQQIVSLDAYAQTDYVIDFSSNRIKKYPNQGFI